MTCNTSVTNSGRTTVHATGTLHVISFGVGIFINTVGYFHARNTNMPPVVSVQLPRDGQLYYGKEGGPGHF